MDEKKPAAAAEKPTTKEKAKKALGSIGTALAFIGVGAFLIVGWLVIDGIGDRIWKWFFNGFITLNADIVVFVIRHWPWVLGAVVLCGIVWFVKSRIE